MLKMILLTIVVLSALAGGTQMLVMNMLEATNTVENSARMRAVNNRLEQAVHFVNGVPYMPYGVEKVNYHALPTSFAGLRKSAKGQEVVYCPYAKNNVTTATTQITLDGIDSYDVSTANLLVGQAYVTESERPPVDGLAAAIILRQKTTSNPSCDDLELNADSDLVLGGDSQGQGRVFGVFFTDLEFIHQSGISERVAVVDGEEELQEAFSRVVSQPYQNALVQIASGETYTLTSSHAFNFLNSAGSRQVVIESDSDGNSATIVSATPITLSFENVTVSFKDIILGSNIAVEVNGEKIDATGTSFSTLALNSVDAKIIDSSSTVTLLTGGSTIIEDSTFGTVASVRPALELINAEVRGLGVISVRSGASVAVSMIDSEWSVGSGLNITYAANAFGVQLQNSSVSFNNTNIASTGDGSILFYVDTNSQLQIVNSTWTNTGALNYALYSQGRTSIVNSALTGGGLVNVGLNTLPGAVTTLTNSVIGSNSSPFSVGWQDEGSMALSGITDIYATQCSNGGRFDTVGDTYGAVQYIDQYATAFNFVLFTPTYTSTAKTGSADIDGAFRMLTINCNP
jgi:hypothetical protein